MYSRSARLVFSFVVVFSFSTFLQTKRIIISDFFYSSKCLQIFLFLCSKCFNISVLSPIFFVFQFKSEDVTHRKYYIFS